MSWISKGLSLAFLGILFATPSMAAQRFVGARIGIGPRVVAGSRIVVGPRVPRVVVRSYVPYYGWYGYYAHGWYYPAYSYYPAYAEPATGEVKIDTHMKDASVYVDGGYVGPVSKFKKFSLEPGNHDIELRDGSGRQIFNQRVQVIAGKVVEIRPLS